MADDLLLYAVGDIAPSRPDPDSLFVKVAPMLRAADIAFCQLEINLTERGTRLPQARHTDRTSPKAAEALRRAGFNVVSWASNHCMDWGKEGFSDTIEALKKADLHVIGAGANIAEARKPAILDRKGTKVAFLSYCSILPMGYWAEEGRPGCAPMRAWTQYEQIEHDQPGTPCRVHTFANRDDLKAMVADVKAVRAQADVVILSLHWGIHFIPAVIADYQHEVARAAIDAGVDLILGHHAHILKGIDVYKGVPIIHSLSNFALDLHMTPAHAASKGFREIQSLHPNWVPDFETSFAFPPDCARTMVVKCLISGKKIRRVSFLPAFIDRQSIPEVLQPSDPRFDEIVTTMERITANQDLAGRFVREGAEIVIAA